MSIPHLREPPSFRVPVSTVVRLHPTEWLRLRELSLLCGMRTGELAAKVLKAFLHQENPVLEVSEGGNENV